MTWDTGANSDGWWSCSAARRQQRDLQVQEGGLELEQVAALAQASHDEIVRAGHHRVEDLVGHAVRGLELAHAVGVAVAHALAQLERGRPRGGDLDQEHPRERRLGGEPAEIRVDAGAGPSEPGRPSAPSCAARMCSSSSSLAASYAARKQSSLSVKCS